MLDPVLRRIFILAAIALLFGVIYLLSPVVLPFVMAFFIAYLFSPVVAVLHRWYLPRWLSISIVFILIMIVMVLIGWYVVPMAWAQLLYARDHIPEMVYWINETFLPWASTTFNLEPMQVNTDEISKIIMDYVQTNYSVDNIQEMLLRLAQSGLNFIQIGATLILVPIVTFYFLLDWEKMLQNLRRMIPRQSEANVVQIAQECHSVLGAFVKGQFLVMILLGLVYAVGLQLIGIHVGLIIGIVAGIASIIPYLGFAVGIIAAVVATFLQFGVDWVQLALVGLVFMIGQAVEGYILQPFLLGDKIGLSPVAVVFAVLAGAQLFGFVGMLIALPVAAVIVVLLRHLRDSYEKSAWYGAHTRVTSLDTTALNRLEELDQPATDPTPPTDDLLQPQPKDK
jgi:predicted PurR-regulated permease PerM